MAPLIAGRRLRILIAEDDPNMSEALLVLIRNLGYDPMAVADGKAALAAIAAQPPDLVISDVLMRELNGFELCRRLKADPATRLIPIVIITGIGDEHKMEGIEAGADDFLSKPFSPRDLQARLRSLLRLKAFVDDLEHAEAVLCTLGNTIEAKDPALQDHCEHLAVHGVALGRLLGLPEESLTDLRRGAYLHDLGKVAVPDAIMLKAGPLTAEERTVVQCHPVVGEEICRPLRSLRTVLPIIRYHHERQDGSGYPDGVRGDEVPLLARVLQVVDVYDSLITARPYRPALEKATALEILKAEAHRGWWDPRIVRLFHVMLSAQETP